MPTVIILGPQGSGKGTQAELLASRHGLDHVEIGAALRKLTRQRQQTAFTRKVARFINRGRLIPTHDLMEIIRHILKGIPRTRGIVFDGTPRKGIEARLLLQLLAAQRRRVTHLFYVHISKRESVRRLSQRWVCLACGHSVTFAKGAKRAGSVCPRCGGTLAQREDDKPAAIAKRLALYQKLTRPVVTLFESSPYFYRIDGEQPVARVAHDVETGFRKGLSLAGRP